MNWLLHPIKSFLMRLAQKKFVKCLEEESLDFFLEILLNFMDLYLALNKKFRRNIENFNARYAFKSQDGRIDASVIFSGSKMKVINHVIDNTNVTVIFKDGKALKNFLFSDSPDIIGAILSSEVQYTGNLNYLAKFAYMAKNLKLQFAPGK
ncbi:MAG: hypothetical protein Q8N05_05485 [Bacteroidota bacterium]|nr:hypothetical protein [Bacteroidota bacterium]